MNYFEYVWDYIYALEFVTGSYDCSYSNIKRTCTASESNSTKYFVVYFTYEIGYETYFRISTSLKLYETYLMCLLDSEVCIKFGRIHINSSHQLM